MGKHILLRNQPTHFGSMGTLVKTEGYNDHKGFFLLCRDVMLPENQHGEVGVIDGELRYRCDRGSWGPIGSHTWDDALQACNCGAVEQANTICDQHWVTLQGNKCAFIVAQAANRGGYLMYIEFHNRLHEEAMLSLPNTDSARTFPEMFKLLLEWDFAYTTLNNREQVAETAHSFLAGIDMPASIREWIETAVPAQGVERFLLGDTNARVRLTGVPDMTDEFEEWVSDIVGDSPILGSQPHYNG